MRRAVYAFSTILLGTLVLTTGCTTKKRHQRDIANLQTQIGALQADVARLDQQLKESESAVKAAREGGVSGSALGQIAGGATYRTPSGFELPAASIQRALKNAGYYQGNIDGKVGPATKSALKNFQRDNGLSADGVCGRQTWNHLKGFLEGSAS